MKVLCVCNHGNVRSVALARAIKDQTEIYTFPIKNEAIAVGAEYISPKTMKLLRDWADKIVWMSDKVFPPNDVIDYRVRVGVDRWHNPFHPELQEIMKEIAKEVLQ